MAFLTDRTLATGVTINDLIHIVITGDTSQNPAGSSYKATLGQFLSVLPPFTGGSGNCITDFYVTNIYGCSPITIQSETKFFNNFATGTLSFSQGQGSQSIGDYSHSEGSYTISSGISSHVEGYYSQAIGDYSHAEGGTGVFSGGTSIGLGSHAEGRETIASGNSSHAEGRGTVSIGTFSHAEGTYTESRGGYSHSEGEVTISIGAGSHSEGEFTISVGQCSHAEGSGTTTYGNYSHSEGLGTITNGDYQHTQGQFNFTSSTQSAFIIGNGTSDSNRSNLVFAAGNDFNIYGDLNVTGTIFSTGSTQFISTTGITISAVTLSTGTTYNGINYAGNVDLTIPSPSGFTGLKIIVKDESGNAGTYRIRLTPSVGTIDGNSYVDMNINYMSLTLVARNNNWWII